MTDATKTWTMADEVIRASEDLVRAAGLAMPTAKGGAAALALALGRVCTVEGVDLDAALVLVRLAHRGEALRGILATALPEEELFTGGRS